MSDQAKFPHEVVDLPSKGLLYPKDHPLSDGKIAIKYMTAREEDILTSTNLIQKGVVIDELLKSVIPKEVKYDDLFLGDKNAIMVATRILGYGKDYKADVTCPVCGNVEKETAFDLTSLEDKKIDNKFYNRKNEYTFKLPVAKRELTYRYLTQKDEAAINLEIERINKVSKGKSSEITTRLRYQIVAIDGDDNRENITKFINNEFFAQDSRAFRTHYMDSMPDLSFDIDYVCPNCTSQTEMTLPIQTNFFWPSR
jgi:rubredoxin